MSGLVCFPRNEKTSSKVHSEIKRRENVARVVPRGLIVVGFKKLQSEFEFWKIFNVCDKCVSCQHLVLKKQKVTLDLPQFWPCHRFFFF